MYQEKGLADKWLKGYKLNHGDMIKIEVQTLLGWLTLNRLILKHLGSIWFDDIKGGLGLYGANI